MSKASSCWWPPSPRLEACFLIREAVGLITNMAASPTASSASNVLKAQWSPVRAVLTKPFPASIRSYGENWQIEVISDPTQSASLAFKMDGNDNIINLSALSAPAQELISYAVIDTMLFRNQPAQLLEVSVNGAHTKRRDWNYRGHCVMQITMLSMTIHQRTCGL